MTSVDIGQFLLHARKRADLKQDALARTVGCTASYIHRLERGKTIPSPEMVVKLARALKLKQSELLQRVVAARMQTRSARVIQEFHDVGLEVPVPTTAVTVDPLRALLEKLGYTPDDFAKLTDDDWETIRSVVGPLIERLLERKATLGKPGNPAKAKTVFIVEDEIKICHVIAGALRDRGVKVDYAFNGKSALTRLLQRREKPDVILLDLRMPMMGGFEFLRQLRKINTHSKVLVMTGHAEDVVELHASDLSIEGYFEKPFNVPELIAKVEDLLR